jgi:hypothetical protein
MRRGRKGERESKGGKEKTGERRETFLSRGETPSTPLFNYNYHVFKILLG